MTSVVSALTPSIAAAVEEALAAQAAAEAAQLEAKRRAAAQAAAAAKANKPDTPDEPAKYNFEYKIADDEAQVYITQNEGRDGNELTGTYSYVDSRGALVTVNYEAGPEGYSETRDEELGFVKIRAQPARVAPAPPVKTDQATLIQKILAILQPQIGSAVSSAIQVLQIFLGQFLQMKNGFHYQLSDNHVSLYSLELFLWLKKEKIVFLLIIKISAERCSLFCSNVYFGVRY